MVFINRFYNFSLLYYNDNLDFQLIFRSLWFDSSIDLLSRAVYKDNKPFFQGYYTTS